MSEPVLLLVVGLPLLALWLYMLVDIVRRRDLSTVRRAIWMVVLILVPVVALGIYIVVRPPRAARFSGGGADISTAEQIVLLAERRQRGEIADDEFEQQVEHVASFD